MSEAALHRVIGRLVAVAARERPPEFELLLIARMVIDKLGVTKDSLRRCLLGSLWRPQAGAPVPRGAT
jgi:hypothetical protein